MKTPFFAMLSKNIAIFLMARMEHSRYLGIRLLNVYRIEREFNAKHDGQRHWIQLCAKVNGVNLKMLCFERAFRHMANAGSG